MTESTLAATADDALLAAVAASWAVSWTSDRSPESTSALMTPPTMDMPFPGE